MTNTGGKMNKTIGKIIFIGAFNASFNVLAITYYQRLLSVESLRGKARRQKLTGR